MMKQVEVLKLTKFILSWFFLLYEFVVRVTLVKIRNWLNANLIPDLMA
jgi:hypothetical protein